MKLRRNAHVALVSLLAASLLVGFFAFVPPRASAGAAIVFSEDFESGVLGPRWTTNDSNPLSGLDYWGVSSYRSDTGNYSAWCAQVGNQSSGPYIGQNNSAVHQYDDNMDANLSLNLAVNGYASLTLSFWYFVRTENGGGDWFQAAYVAGGVTTVIFQKGGSSANTWLSANLTVPVNIERLQFVFHSDGTNHGFEGAYVDDIVMTGIDDISPSSNVLPLPSNTKDNPLAIPYVAQDNPNGSGIAYVELWYRHGTSGNFTLYNTSENPLGRWTTPAIPFDVRLAAGDGYYEFYSIAVDRAGNREARPSTADASTTIDTSFPWYIVGIIVAVVIAGLLFFVWWKRRKEKEEEEQALIAAAGAAGAPKTPASFKEAEKPDESETPSEMPEEMPTGPPP